MLSSFSSKSLGKVRALFHLKIRNGYSEQAPYLPKIADIVTLVLPQRLRELYSLCFLPGHLIFLMIIFVIFFSFRLVNFTVPNGMWSTTNMNSTLETSDSYPGKNLSRVFLGCFHIQNMISAKVLPLFMNTCVLI